METELKALAHLPLQGVFKKWFAGDPEVSGIAAYTDLKLISSETRQAVIEFTPDRRHANPGGGLQGGVLATVADAAIGTAFVSTLAKGEGFASVDLVIKYLRPAEGLLRFEARVVQRGSRLGLAECDVTDAAGRLVTRVFSTLMVLPGGKEAAG